MCERKKLLIVGCGGFGRVVSEYARKEYDCAFVDDGYEAGMDICDIPVVGHLSVLAKLFLSYQKLIIAIGNNVFREKVYQKSREIGYTFPNIICDSVYISPTLKMQRRMTVYTPAGYDKGKDYPVLYLLHGAGGDEDAWTTLGRAQHILDNLIATGKAKPMVVVMTNGNPNCQAAPGEWSAGMYVPSFYGYQGAKAVATMDESFPDVMNYVESHYKVGKDKAHRAICGLSMGGGHSFDISRRFPNKFDYVGLFSAGLHVGKTGDFRTDFYKMLQEDEEAKQQLATLFKNKPKLYWIGMGKTDFLYKSTAGLRRYFDEKGYKYTYMETEGGHIWRNWRVYLTEFAQKIFK